MNSICNFFFLCLLPSSYLFKYHIYCNLSSVVLCCSHALYLWAHCVIWNDFCFVLIIIIIIWWTNKYMCITHNETNSKLRSHKTCFALLSWSSSAALALLVSCMRSVKADPVASCCLRMSAAVCTSRFSTSTRRDAELFLSFSALLIFVSENVSHSWGVTASLEHRNGWNHKSKI